MTNAYRVTAGLFSDQSGHIFCKFQNQSPVEFQMSQIKDRRIAYKNWKA